MDHPPLTLEELRLLERYFSTLAPFEFLVKARNAMRELIALREGKTVDGKFLASFGPEVERESFSAQPEEGSE